MSSHRQQAALQPAAASRRCRHHASAHRCQETACRCRRAQPHSTSHRSPHEQQHQHRCARPAAVHPETGPRPAPAPARRGQRHQQTDARHNHAPPASPAQPRCLLHSRQVTLEPSARAAAAQQRLHNDEIGWRSDLVRRRLARHRHHRAPRSLHQRSIVGRLGLPSMSRYQRLPPKRLRRLNPKQSRTIHRARNDSARVAPLRHPLQRVAHSKRRHSSISPTPHSSDHALEQSRRRPRPSSVMAHHHVHIIRNHLQPSPNRPRPSPPTSHDRVQARAEPVNHGRCDYERHSVTRRPSNFDTPGNHRPPRDVRHHLGVTASHGPIPRPLASSQYKSPRPPHPPSLPKSRTQGDEGWGGAGVPVRSYEAPRPHPIRRPRASSV